MRAAIVTSRKIRRRCGVANATCAGAISGTERIESLEKDSTDLVYLVPFALLETPGWNDHRVRLARASRFYVVFGKELDSRKIMNAARGRRARCARSDHRQKRALLSALEQAANAQALWWQTLRRAGRGRRGKLTGRSRRDEGPARIHSTPWPTDATIPHPRRIRHGQGSAWPRRFTRARARGDSCDQLRGVARGIAESELFGAEKGAYTGADRAKPGLVEEAAGGTLFLDEIGELPLAAPAEIIRFLETRQRAAWQHQGIPLAGARDLRHNRDLHRDADGGLPPRFILSPGGNQSSPRRRCAIARRTSRIWRGCFCGRRASAWAKNFESLEPELVYKFQLHDWPGNVRELRRPSSGWRFHYDGPVMRGRLVGTAAARDARPASPSRQIARLGRAAEWRCRSVSGIRRRCSGAGSRWAGAGASRSRAVDAGGRRGPHLGAAQVGIHPTTLYRWRKTGKV